MSTTKKKPAATSTKAAKTTKEQAAKAKSTTRHDTAVRTAKKKKPVKWRSPTFDELFASNQPPTMPPVVPALVDAVTISTPDIFKEHVAQRCFAPLGVYPIGVEFEYIDNRPRSLRINCLGVSVSGGGKDTSFTPVRKHILRDMDERDIINRKRIEDYKEECASLEGTEKTPKRPKDAIVQGILPNITPAELVQKMLDAGDATLYLPLNELEKWDGVEGKAKHQFTVLKTADDEDNEYGADRAGTKSVSGKGCLRLNWDASATIGFAQKYFGRAVNEGPIQRTIMVMIPEQDIDADIPIYGKYDAKYDARLKPFIENLKAAKGYVVCKEAKAFIGKLKKEFDQFNVKSQDRTLSVLGRRSLVAAFRKACLIYAANGMRWEKGITEDFCRWSFQMDMWCKAKFFLEQIRKADDSVMIAKTGPRNKLALLPDEFTQDDAAKMREKEGMKPEGNYDMLAQWLKRKYIERLDKERYRKTESGKKL